MCKFTERDSAYRGGELEDVLGHVGRDQHVVDLGFHVVDVDGDEVARRVVAGVERDVVEDALDARVEAPRADVLDGPIGQRRDACDLAHGAVRELQHDVLRGQQRALLRDEVVRRLREDPVHVRLCERVELDADGQAALELRQQIRRLGLVERARRDEEDVVRVHVAVLRLDRRALDQRQQVPLDALRGRVGAAVVRRVDDLVDLVDEHDPGLLDGRDGLAVDVDALEQFLELLLLDQRPRVSNGHALPLRPAFPLARELVESPEEVVDGDGVRLVQLDHAALGLLRHLVRQVHVDLAVVEHALAEHLAERRLRRLRRVEARERVQNPRLDQALRLRAELLGLALSGERDRRLDQIPDDLVDVAAVEPDLRELRRFYFDERRVGHLREAPRDLRLAAARRANHQNVLRHDLRLELFAQELVAPAISERNRHRALRGGLPDDVLVELGHRGARRHG
mmetsp:Transcript_16045/g.49648  ORF Transcript_16045/g.49648 Transcript_16045/m.49648 type:complete len:455 (+) Transcript_16045:16-1380(+)